MEALIKWLSVILNKVKDLQFARIVAKKQISPLRFASVEMTKKLNQRLPRALSDS